MSAWEWLAGRGPLFDSWHNWLYRRSHDPVDWAESWPEFSHPPEAHVRHVEPTEPAEPRLVSRWPRLR